MSTLGEVLLNASAQGRVCPMPQYWNELWELLPNRTRVGNGWNPPAPLILAAWWHTSNAEKRERLAAHIRYASEHGALDQVASLLSSLSPGHWHYESDVDAQ